MTAPALWIYFPAAASVVLYFLRRWERVSHLAGMAVMVFLAALAWQIPINQPIRLGIPGVAPFRILESSPILGQTLTITLTSQPVLIIIYLGMSMWFGGAYLAKIDRLFIPLATAAAALLTASFAIQLRSISVILVEMVALICVPILSPPGKPVGRGVLRFLVFQTLGMMLILLADWMLRANVMNPEFSALLPSATVILGLGFALMGAIFPFHTWIPMLAREAHPYAAAFVIFLIPTSLSFLGLDYLNAYRDMEISTVIFTAIRGAGVLMMIGGGLWAMFERHLARMMGYGAIVQIGMGLLSISLIEVVSTNSPPGGLFFAQLFPQLISLSVWSLALSSIRQRKPGLLFYQVQGLAHQMPLTVACLSLASLSLAGIPLLASFPGNITLWSTLSPGYLPYSLLSLFGTMCLFAATLRASAVFVMSPEPGAWQMSEKGFLPLLLVAGVLFLFVIGLAPQVFLPVLTNLASIFIFQAP